MATKTIEVCDILGRTKGLETYTVVVVKGLNPDIEIVPSEGGKGEIVFESVKVMCPGAVKRALRFINKAVKPPSKR